MCEIHDASIHHRTGADGDNKDIEAQWTRGKRAGSAMARRLMGALAVIGSLALLWSLHTHAAVALAYADDARILAGMGVVLVIVAAAAVLIMHRMRRTRRPTGLRKRRGHGL